jgi:hypothetical protein
VTTIKEWYQKTNDAWPKEIPPLTFEAGSNAAQRLHRFVTGENWVGTFIETSGNRYSSYPRRGRYPINTETGWHRLIHDISHYHWRRHVGIGQKPHAKGHARFELKLVKEVVKRGWLTPSSPSEPVVIDPAVVKRAEALKKQERIAAAIRRWNAKLKRAETALKKLNRKEKYYASKLDNHAG